MKRITTLILAFSLILTSFTFANNAKAEVSNDYAFNTKYIDILSALGLASKSDFSDTTSKLTRAKAVTLLMKTLNLDNSVINDANGNFPFTDVDPSSQDYKYIYHAHRMGIVSAASLFNPDSTVTASQFAKMAVCILGYGELAGYKGGWPTGYLYYANDLELFENVDFLSENDEILVGDAPALIYNMVTANMMTPSSFGDTSSYEIIEGKNILSVYHDIDIVNGILQEDKNMSMYIQSGLDSDEIMISNVKYNAPGIDTFFKLGLSVDAYIKEANGKKTILYLDYDRDDNTVVEITGNDISSASASKITYYTDGTKEASKNIKSGASYIYNGQFRAYYDGIYQDADLVKLVDGDGDSKFDVVYINKYVNIQAEAVSYDDEIVYDGISGNSYNLNTDSVKTQYIYKGAITDIYEIEVDSIVSLLIPANTAINHIYYAYVCDNKIEGSVSSIDSSEGIITINEAVYKAASSFISKVKLGETAAFYFDITGKLVAKSVIASSDKYGYLVDFAAASSSLEEPKFKIFGDDGEWYIFDINKKIKINDTSYTKSTIGTNTDILTGGTTVIPQLIKYKTSLEGGITEIVTARDYTAQRYTHEEEQADQEGIFRKSFETSSIRYITNSANTFEGKVYVGAKAKIFMIPATTNDYDEYEITDRNSLIHWNTYNNLVAYNAAPTGECELIVAQSLGSDTASILKSSSAILVTKVTDGIDADGDECYKVYGYLDGYETDFIVPKDDATLISAVNSLNTGDVIRVRMNINKEIVAMTTMCTPSTADGIYDGALSTEYIGIVGNVVRISDGYIVIDYDSSTDSIINIADSIYVYDSSRGTTRVGKLSDITIGDKIYARINYLKAKTIVVYK